MSDYLKAATRQRQTRGVSSCLNHSQIVAFYSRQLDETETESIRAHLAECSECLELARDARQFLQSMSGPVEADAAGRASSTVAVPDTTEGNQPTLWWSSLRDLFQKPFLGLSLAAATLVLLVASSVLVTINRRLHSQIERLRAAQQGPEERDRELERQLVEHRAQTKELETQLEKQRSERAELQKKLASQSSGQRGGVKQGGAPGIVMLVLRPGLLRGFDNPNTLVVPKEAARVGLEINLESDEYATYQAVLSSVDGETVWNSGELTVRRLASGRYVSLSLPSALFTKRDYIIRLNGVTSGGRSEKLEQYLLQVVRQQ
jgi:Putative zinc-finger